MCGLKTEFGSQSICTWDDSGLTAEWPSLLRVFCFAAHQDMVLEGNAIFQVRNTVRLKPSKIKASDEPLKFLLEGCTAAVHLYHSLKHEHFCVGGWGKAAQPSSNMDNKGSPPSYTRLSAPRMCLAQVAGRWGNTWHSECFPNVSVWDKGDESPERK